MKKNKYILQSVFIVLLTAVCASCNIDEYNPSGATAEEIWSTPQGFVSVVNAAYSEQRSWYGKEDGIFMAEAGTDLWFNRDKNTYAQQLTRYTSFSPETGNPNKAAWRFLYQAINLCNAGINRINSAGFTDIMERNRREGELRFLRGFYYWHIVETYGGVILRTRETQSPEVTATRSSVEEFYELIISDLQFAAEHLPNEWGNEYSRATKKAALGFLARVYLSRAYYAAGAERDNYFTLARATAQEVIDRQAEFKVRLWPNYADLWLPANNKRLGIADGEALHIVSNSTNPNFNYNGQGSFVHSTFMTRYYSAPKPGLVASIEYGYDNSRRLMPTRALLEFYNENIDARYAGSFQEVWITNLADDARTAQDERFKWTSSNIGTFGKDASLIDRVLVPGVDTSMYITKKIVSNKSTRPYAVYDINDIYNANGTIKTGQDYPYLKKYLDHTRPSVASQFGFNDIVVMRLAEMYMIAAEAEFQLGLLDEAAEHINVLRTRAAIKAPVDQTAAMQISGGDVTLDFILDERAREFAGEYMRWFDLKRTGKLVDRVVQYNPDVTAIQSFHVLRPIPIDEMQALLNAEEFGQNDGY